MGFLWYNNSVGSRSLFAPDAGRTSGVQPEKGRFTVSDLILELEDITKSFGNTQVLRGISLSVRKGEFITFLGASGCGKTTTLRIIAGLETPDSGRVMLNGQDVTGLEPNRRNVNTVFQNYALFPHMDVYTNIAYGLKLKKTAKDEIRERVTQALELVQLSGYEKRMPSELSGGQKQRVAIARAVVNNPQVLLLDEPLGALDLQLRRQMQVELKRLQKRLGITFVYITHDQEEALNMSDRIVVMKDGLFQQIGTPDEVYNHPLTSYVARFVGTANLITGTVERIEEDGVLIRTEAGMAHAALESWQRPLVSAGQTVTAAVRSEHLQLERLPEESDAQPADGALTVSGAKAETGLTLTVTEKSFAGGMVRISLDGGSMGELVSSRQGIDSPVSPGDRVLARWNSQDAVLVDLQSQEAGQS